MSELQVLCNVTTLLFYYSGANEEVKLAKRKLQMLSNHVFEELAMDVYDEVDRRETDTIWNSVHMKVILLLNYYMYLCS